jgi:8-oxo-dGTP pyrophosphatase MutT (NUDIX family)
MDMKYVIGLAFNEAHTKVLLQLKKRGPEFNIGWLNPPGGKVEQYPRDTEDPRYGMKYESYNGAMRREFEEETGLASAQGDWMKFHYERHPSGAKLHCYVTDSLDIMAAQTTTDEPNVIVELGYSRTYEWKFPMGYLWCQHADGIGGLSQKEYEERIEVQTKKRGGLAYNMPYMIPMALAYLRHPEHRYLEG